MGSNLKQTIMDTARHLFSERGFQNTSMRDIAAVLHISVGNLTYHYKKKEELITAILVEDHQKYQKSTPFSTLKEFDLLLQKVAEQKESRPYYFKHYVQLSQICPAVYEMQVSVLQNLNDVLVTSFRNFVELGILRDDFGQEYDKIAVAIVALMVHGLPDFPPMQENKKDICWFDCVWSIIIPCLSKQGRKEYQLLIEQKKGLS